MLKHGVAVMLANGTKMAVSKRIGTTYFPDHWQFPGGTQEDGEDLRDVGVREVEEETGLKLEKSRLRYLGSYHHMSDPQYRAHLFACRLEPKEAKRLRNKEPEKHSDWEWVTARELETRLLMPAMRPVLDSLGEGFWNDTESTTGAEAP